MTDRMRLIKHDVLIMGKSAAIAFGTARDVGLLIAVAAIGVAWLSSQREAFQSALAVLPLGAVAAAIALLGTLVGMGIRRRLQELASDSILAGDALHRGIQRGYACFWHGVALAGLALPTGFLLSNRPAADATMAVISILTLYFAAGGVVAWAAGMLSDAPSLWRVKRLGRRPKLDLRQPTAWRRLATATACHQSVFSRGLEGAVVEAAAAGVAIGLTSALMDPAINPALAIAALLVAIAIMGLLLRVDYSLVRYASFIGFSAAATAGAHLLMPLTFGLSLLLTQALAGAGEGVFAAAALMIGSTVLIVALRVAQYRIRTRRSADLAVQIDLGGTILLAAVMAPLGLLFFVSRAAALVRRTGKATWLAE